MGPTDATDVASTTVPTLVATGRSDPATPLLVVEGLTVEFPMDQGWATVVDDVSFHVAAGESVGLVGESGSGKTVSSLALLGLTSRTGGRVKSGSIRFLGRELVRCPERELRRLRGQEIAMIFQQASRSLNPAYTVGDQISETIRRHTGLGRKAARQRAIQLLERVRIPNAAQRYRDYPHQFSGGMLQRVMIAMAVSCEPRLLIADEPTTALDVSVQASILELLEELQRETGLAIVFVSHDLAVIAEICDRVVVMYAGQAVEEASAAQLFVTPRHPYTAALLGSIPRLGVTRRLETIPGRVPPIGSNLVGCRFHPRCGFAQAGRCDEIPPPMLPTESGSLARCLRVDEIELRGIDLAEQAAVRREAP